VSKQASALRAAQRTTRVPLSAHLEKARDPGVHRAQVLRTGEAVLGEIDTAAAGDHVLVEAVDHLLGVVADGDVERQRDPLPWKREQALTLGPAVLDDREKGAGAEPVQRVEHAADAGG